MAPAEEKKENMVMLRSRDGVYFVVPEREASLSMFIDDKLSDGYPNYIIPSDGDEAKYKPIRLPVERNTLAMVLRYCHKHSSSSGDSDDDPDWDAEFIAGADSETLLDLILASNYLEIRGLLDLVCHAIASKIKGKSPSEICHIFNIKSVFTPELDEETMAKPSQHRLKGILVVPKEKPSLNELELEEKALRALHIVCCQDFTRYDPKLHGFVCSRLKHYNVALFDHDKETDFCRGPPLHKLRMRDSTVQSCINVISLKVCESDVGFPINIFGSVVARDEVDYRCVYLFRRELDDPQRINSEDDLLALTDPCRGLVLVNEIIFEIDLKIKCDGGEIKDFSRGITAFEYARLPSGDQIMTPGLISCLSEVELACAYVYQPVEATIAINVLKGSCNISRVFASTHGNFKNHIILYEAAAGALQVGLGEGSSFPLTRRVVAVSLNQKMALVFVGGDDVFEHLVLTLEHYDQVICRKMGAAELEVRVTWTAILRRQRPDMFRLVGNQRLLL